MFTIADVIKLLTRIFVKENKRFPKGLEGVDIRLKAHKIHDVAKSQGYTGGIGENQLKHFLALEKQAQGPTIRGHRIISGDSPEGKKITEDLFGKKGEVVDMTGKKIDTSKPILGGKNVEDVVTETVTNMKKMTPIDAMKEANSVIARKGKYKTLTPEESKKILKDTEDHIFERDIPDEDFAGGGVAGLLGENHRVPYGGGGTGRPPVTFTLTGGGGYGKNKNIQDMGQTIPGLNQEQYGYGFNLGTEIGLPWNFSLTGDVGIGRGSTKTDYKGQPIGGMSGVGETKLGDQWNVGLNWKKKVDFNKWLMGKADGGIAGMLGEGPDKYSPKNFYALGIGPVLQDYLLGERPVDEEGFHTTLNKEDLENLLNLLKEESGFEDIKDELMFRFGRVNPEKKHSFHLGLGKDKAEIGFKKQFAGGGIAGMLGEPTYADDNHRVPLKWGKRPISAGIQVLDPDFDDLDPDEWLEIIKSAKSGAYGAAEGGRVPLSWGGFLMKLLQKSPSKLESLKDFTSKREFILSLIGQGSKQKNKRMMAQIKEEMEKIRKNPPFKFADTDEIKKEVWKELTKGITKHADGGRVPLALGRGTDQAIAEN